MDTIPKTGKLEIIKVILTAGSIAFAGLGYYLHEKEALRSYNLHKQVEQRNYMAKQLSETIQNKVITMQHLANTVADMRKTRTEIVLKCKNHTALSQYEQNTQRFAARHNVAIAFTGIRFIFNDKVQAKANELTNFDESVPDVCAPNAPSDKQWWQYYYDLTQLMGESIQADRETLIKLGYNEGVPYTASINLYSTVYDNK